MRNQLLLLLASFAFGISAAWAQSVSGKVTDSSNGEGLPGAAVVGEGSNTGVMSDMEPASCGGRSVHARAYTLGAAAVERGAGRRGVN